VGRNKWERNAVKGKIRDKWEEAVEMLIPPIPRIDERNT
jgi:hypothetical protein